MRALTGSPDLLRPSLYSIVSFSHQLSVEEAVEEMDLKEEENAVLWNQNDPTTSDGGIVIVFYLVIGRIHHQLPVHVHHLKQKRANNDILLNGARYHMDERCANLIIEPVLIRQRAQVVQGQRVLLVDHLKGWHRVLNDRSSVSVNLREDGVFTAIWGDKVQSIWSKCFINNLQSSTTDLLLKSMLNVLLRCLSTSVFCRGMKLPYIL